MRPVVALWPTMKFLLFSENDFFSGGPNLILLRLLPFCTKLSAELGSKTKSSIWSLWTLEVEPKVSLKLYVYGGILNWEYGFIYIILYLFMRYSDGN